MTFRGALALGSILALASAPVAAQTYPDKPVKLVVAFDPGGTADRIARIVSDKLSARLKVQVFVENRAGSSGTIGSLFVAKAAPDGYTLLIGGSGPHITAPTINPNTGYDPLRDFTHMTMIAGDTYVLAAGQQTGFKTVADLMAATRTAKPPVSYGSPGAGSLGHLIMESFVHAAKVPFTHVPYRGGGPAIKDLMGGHVATVLLPVINLAELLKAGSVTALAVTSTERHAAYPAIPTFIEQGHQVQGTTWFWLAGPKGLPAPVADKLDRELREVLADADVKRSFEAQALLVKALTRDQLNAFLADEIKLWAKIIKDINFKLE